MAPLLSFFEKSKKGEGLNYKMRTIQTFFEVPKHRYNPNEPLDIKIERIKTTGWREALNWFNDYQIALDELEGTEREHFNAFLGFIRFFKERELKLAEREGF